MNRKRFESKIVQYDAKTVILKPTIQARKGPVDGGLRFGPRPIVLVTN